MRNRKLISGLVLITMAIATILLFIRPARALEDRVPYPGEMRSLAGINFGVATLSSGVATVPDAYVSTGDCIQLTPYAQGLSIGVAGTTNVCQVSNIINGTSFQIVEIGSASASTNKVAWLILRNPPHN